MAFRRCLGGCGKRIQTGSRCTSCQLRDPAAPWSRNRNNAEHKRFARAVRKRDGGRCVRCGSDDRLRAAHVRPLAEGGTNDLENGELRCYTCDRQLDSFAR